MGTNQALSSESFQKKLAFGQIAETAIARWIMSRGGIVLPVYDLEYETGKGPRVFKLGASLIAPDLLVFRSGNICWIEAKHKTVFTWYRIKCQWETGIDAHHYRQYCQVQKDIGVPVWLLLLHRKSIPWTSDRQYGCPDQCPTGLFGNKLDALSNCGRFDSRYGRTGMVYWPHKSLLYLAPLSELQPK